MAYMIYACDGCRVKHYTRAEKRVSVSFEEWKELKEFWDEGHPQHNPDTTGVVAMDYTPHLDGLTEKDVAALRRLIIP